VKNHFQLNDKIRKYCISKVNYIFASWNDMFIFSKSFELLNTYECYEIKSITAYHNDCSIVLIGRNKNEI
jgi:hypothetical protein